MTRPTLAEFEKTNEARKLIAQNVLVWTNELCNALKNDYIRTSVESYKRKLHSASSEWDVNYYTQRIEEIKNLNNKHASENKQYDKAKGSHPGQQAVDKAQGMLNAEHALWSMERCQKSKSSTCSTHATVRRVH